MSNRKTQPLIGLAQNPETTDVSYGSTREKLAKMVRIVPKTNDNINKLFELNRLKMNTCNIAIKHIWFK